MSSESNTMPEGNERGRSGESAGSADDLEQSSAAILIEALAEADWPVRWELLATYPMLNSRLVARRLIRRDMGLATLLVDLVNRGHGDARECADTVIELERIRTDPAPAIGPATLTVFHTAISLIEADRPWIGPITMAAWSNIMDRRATLDERLVEVSVRIIATRVRDPGLLRDAIGLIEVSTATGIEAILHRHATNLQRLAGAVDELGLSLRWHGLLNTRVITRDIVRALYLGIDNDSESVPRALSNIRALRVLSYLACNPATGTHGSPELEEMFDHAQTVSKIQDGNVIAVVGEVTEAMMRAELPERLLWRALRLRGQYLITAAEAGFKAPREALQQAAQAFDKARSIYGGEKLGREMLLEAAWARLLLAQSGGGDFDAAVLEGSGLLEEFASSNPEEPRRLLEFLSDRLDIIRMHRGVQAHLMANVNRLAGAPPIASTGWARLKPVRAARLQIAFAKSFKGLNSIEQEMCWVVAAATGVSATPLGAGLELDERSMLGIKQALLAAAATESAVKPRQYYLAALNASNDYIRASDGKVRVHALTRLAGLIRVGVQKEFIRPAALELAISIGCAARDLCVEHDRHFALALVSLADTIEAQLHLGAAGSDGLATRAELLRHALEHLPGPTTRLGVMKRYVTAVDHAVRAGQQRPVELLAALRRLTDFMRLLPVEEVRGTELMYLHGLLAVKCIVLGYLNDEGSLQTAEQGCIGFASERPGMKSFALQFSYLLTVGGPNSRYSVSWKTVSDLQESAPLLRLYLCGNDEYGASARQWMTRTAVTAGYEAVKSLDEDLDPLGLLPEIVIATHLRALYEDEQTRSSSLDDVVSVARRLLGETTVDHPRYIDRLALLGECLVARMSRGGSGNLVQEALGLAQRFESYRNAFGSTAHVRRVMRRRCEVMLRELPLLIAERSAMELGLRALVLLHHDVWGIELFGRDDATAEGRADSEAKAPWSAALERERRRLESAWMSHLAPFDEAWRELQSFASQQHSVEPTDDASGRSRSSDWLVYLHSSAEQCMAIARGPQRQFRLHVSQFGSSRLRDAVVKMTADPASAEQLMAQMRDVWVGVEQVLCEAEADHGIRLVAAGHHAGLPWMAVAGETRKVRSVSVLEAAQARLEGDALPPATMNVLLTLGADSLPLSGIDCDVARGILGSGVAVDGEGSDVKRIVACLDSASVLILSGHGLHHTKDGGFVVAGDTVVTGANLRGIPHRRRQFAFVAACSAGQTGVEFPYDGSGLVASLTEMGFEYVLAPLWPVRDSVAFLSLARFLDAVRSRPDPDIPAVMADVQTWLRRSTCAEVLAYVGTLPVSDISPALDRLRRVFRGLRPSSHPYEDAADWAGFQAFSPIDAREMV